MVFSYSAHLLLPAVPKWEEKNPQRLSALPSLTASCKYLLLCTKTLHTHWQFFPTALFVLFAQVVTWDEQHCSSRAKPKAQLGSCCLAPWMSFPNPDQLLKSEGGFTVPHLFSASVFMHSVLASVGTGQSGSEFNELCFFLCDSCSCEFCHWNHWKGRKH